MTDQQKAREHKVDVHIARRGVRDENILAAMRTVPRERFVGKAVAEFAYEDAPLPIEERQTISQPFVVAVMIEGAEVRPADHVLEVGAGSGHAHGGMGFRGVAVGGLERDEVVVEAVGVEAMAQASAIAVRNRDPERSWRLVVASCPI